jgi:predicted transcriptional regulator
MDMSQMMRQVQNMMPVGIGVPSGNQGPLNLSSDLTRAQFLILTKYQQGFAKPKDIAKHLSMDKKQVEKETNSLRSNGYLSGKNKLTSKGLETLS